jgi:hypothetical protein
VPSPRNAYNPVPPPLQKERPKEMTQKTYAHSRPDTTDPYCEYQTKQMKAALEGVVGKVVQFHSLEVIDMTAKS